MSRTSTDTDIQTQFVKLFSHGGIDMQLPAQLQARERLQSLQIPTRKDEDWKYSSFRKLLSRDFSAPGLPDLDIADFLIPGLEADRLVFVNGMYAAQHSDLSLNGDNLRFSSIAELSGADLELFNKHFAQHLGEREDWFTALNTAFLQDGFLLHIPANTILPYPIQIIQVDGDSDRSVAAQQRNLIVAGRSSQATLIETRFCRSDQAVFTNALTEIVVEANASLELIKIELGGDRSSLMDRCMVSQDRDSRFSVFTFTAGGEMCRNHLEISLEAENAEAKLDGAYLLMGAEHLDNFTKVHHLEPHCLSDELYKGIVGGKATSVFTGKIHVYPQAQKTLAYQSNRNILLSDTANVYSKPQLEIYADDVKCSHGATTGKIESEALFYLQTRGIPIDQARKMLVRAFIMERAEMLSQQPLVDFLSQIIEDRF